jgi:hypothetical protein
MAVTPGRWPEGVTELEGGSFGKFRIVMGVTLLKQIPHRQVRDGALIRAFVRWTAKATTTRTGFLVIRPGIITGFKVTV